ncbi:DUF3223 domain-containing protein [Rhizobium leguminosarum]|uniref:DCL family protein n=1 Tax=Rhizobium leguminosarum TaxID=384 RepID=UPI0010302D66|nr:DCL family protein [Rhizobium leguminosarum]TAU13816.1 DUF3223 domain-containing protein [Rhizobium leguminosarum]TAU34512.1 DUF3223 domain-containing protein [Rhizobium leguminosarum]
MAKPIRLSNGKCLKTQGAALEHFRKMLARYGDNCLVDDHDDHADLIALIERYDTVESDGPPKMGVGISRFERRLNRGAGFTSPGFWILRTDGSITDFSYVSAVRGVPKTLSEEFYDACRNAIGPELLATKQRYFKEFSDVEGRLPCDLTDMPLIYSEAELSHAVPSFGKIVADFKASQGWDASIPLGVLTQSADAQISTSFIDPAISAAFRTFHHARAVLRIVATKRDPNGPPLKTTLVRRPIILQ